MTIRCNECGRSKFDRQGCCEYCQTYSFEKIDAIKQAEFEAKKREGKI